MMSTGAHRCLLVLLAGVLSGCEGGPPGVLSTTTTSEISAATAGSTGSTGDESTAGTTDTAGCGNGSVEPPEACDDGNAVEGDGCNNDCQVSGAMVWCNYDIGEDGGSNAGYAIAVDSQGDPVVVGASKGQSPDDAGAFVAKYTSDGALAWLHRIPDSSHASGIVIDSSDRITIAVVLKVDNALLRMDPSGAVLWTKVIAEDRSFANNNLALARGDSIAIIGDTRTQPRRAWIAGVSGDGEIAWQQAPEDVEAETTSYALAADQEGNWLVVGTRVAKLIDQGGDVEPIAITDGFVRKFSSTGDPVWLRSLAAKSDDASLTLSGVVEDGSQRVRVVGYIGEAGAATAMHAMFSASGELLAERALDIPSESAFVRGLVSTTTDDVVIPGMLKRSEDETFSAYSARFGGDGVTRWTYNSLLVAGRSSTFLAVARHPEGYLYASGRQNIMAIPETRVLICKIAP